MGVEVCMALRAFAPKAKLYAIASHGYFSGEAHLQIKKLVDTCNLEWIAVTNTVTQRGAWRRFSESGLANRLKIIDISKLIASAIIRVHLGTALNLPAFRSLGPTVPDPLLNQAPDQGFQLGASTSAEQCSGIGGSDDD